MNAIADLLLGIGKVIREAVGRSAEQWAKLVEEHPRGAASLLDIAASRLEGRARAFRNQSGWRARRNREVAKDLRREALALRASALTGVCPVALKSAPWKRA